MKMKIIACLAFLLNTILFGTYYSVAKEALGRMDPIIFTFFVMTALVPVGLGIIAFSWKNITREVVKSGFVLGSCLCLGLFTVSIALKYNSATSTAFFPSLNGLIAAVFTWLFLRQPITKATWFAGVVSVTGAILLIVNSSIGGVRGSLIAFIGGLFCTFYVFLADREQKGKTAWPLFGIELLTMAIWANLIALLFGDWQSVHASLPKDIWIILYIAGGTTFLPTLITVLLQKYISPVTVSFIYILEPILGAVVAALYLRETLPLDGYIGGALVVAGAIIHTWGTAEQPSDNLTLQHRLTLAGQRMQTSLLGTLGYPLLCFGIGCFIVFKLGGFPPYSWRQLYLIAPQFPMLIRQGHGIAIVLLVAQALSWIIAWSALVVMGLLATSRALGRFFTPPKVLTLDAREIRMLKQMGIAPNSASSMKRKRENQLVQRRRRERRERLAHVEFVE